VETIQQQLVSDRRAEISPTSEVDSKRPSLAGTPASQTANSAVLRSEFSTESDMAEILADFVNGLPGQVAQISQLLDERNLGELRRSLHRIKGAGGGYGFPQMTQIAGQTEKQIDAGATLEAVAAEIAALINLIRSVEGYDAAKEIAHVAKSIGN
jgi:HPt (histidine-containing phosphotransfer) domain-containing protein